MSQELLSTNSQDFDGTLCQRMGQREKMHNPQDLVELARTVQTADSHAVAMVGSKLELITDQIKALQAQARAVLEDAQKDLSLSHAKCNFQRRPGTTYHLYERKLREGGVRSRPRVGARARPRLTPPFRPSSSSRCCPLWSMAGALPTPTSTRTAWSTI